MSTDHDASAATVPMVLLDLTTKTGEAILWDILPSNNVLGVHMGLPCGTASLARERPVAASLRALGVPNPPLLRSAQHPLGLPNLGSFHQAKVDAANQLYRLGVEILVYCHRRGIVVSIENPATSWIWAALVRISLEHSDEDARVLNRLERVEFHACCHGSTRRKHTAWFGTDKVFSQLAAVCNYDHPHDAWGSDGLQMDGCLIHQQRLLTRSFWPKGLSVASSKRPKLDKSAWTDPCGFTMQPPQCRGSNQSDTSR